MTTAQYAQAITEAYSTYCKLYYDGKSSRQEQEAQFEVYLKLIEAYNANGK